MSADEASGLARARELLSEASSICALTGAGVSAESGVPTFRGEEGLWKSYVPEELATPQAFQAGSPTCLGVVRVAKGEDRGVQPNPGHEALAELALGARRSASLRKTWMGFMRRRLVPSRDRTPLARPFPLSCTDPSSV